MNIVGLLFQISANNADALAALNQLQNQSGSTTAAVSSDFSKMAGKIGSKISEIGSKISGIGATMSVGITAPITAAAFALGRFGLDIQALKNQLTAFEGSSEAAEARLASLRALVDGTSGATREMAYEIYGMLKPLRTSDETIDKTIASIGRLKLGFKNLIPSDFTYNLTQIFGQGFEEQDIKQAIGQVPKFREYLVKAFGTSDNATLKEMKNSGKITMESFFTGIADAVQNDSMLAGLAEPTALRMQKFFEKSFEAVEPIANRIVEIIANLINLALPYLEQFAAWFKDLSPVFQTVIIAVAAVAAAIGPLLVIIGSMVGAVGTLIASASGIGIALLAVIGVVIQLGPTIAVATTAVIALYKAWQINFGGIRDYTLAAFDFIKTAIGAAMTSIYETVQVIGGTIVGWWKDNYSQIRQTVETVSNAVKATIESFLSTISAFWSEHGERIKTFVGGMWETVKLLVSGAMEFIGSAIKLAMQVINGDWSGAWQSVQKIVEIAFRNLGALQSSFINNLTNWLKAIAPILIEYAGKFLATAVSWATKIVVGIVYVWQTLPKRLVELIPKIYDALKDVGATMWRAFWEGWEQGKNQNPISIPSQVVGAVDGIGATGGLSYEQKNSSDTVADTSILESQRKEREKILKKQIQDLKEYNQLELESVRSNFERVNEEWEKKLKSGEVKVADYQSSIFVSIQNFQNKINELLDEGYQLNKKDKSGQELDNEYQRYLNASEKFAVEINKLREDAEKNVTEIQKNENEKQIKNTQQKIKDEISLKEVATQTILARNEKDFAEGRIKEDQLIKARANLQSNLLEFKKQKLAEELIAVKGNVDEENRVKQEQKLLNEEIDRQKQESAKETADFVKQQTESEIDSAQALLRIKREVLEEEIRLEDFRREQERKRLTNDVEFLIGKAKLKALIALRNFEESEAKRQKENTAKDNQFQRDTELAEIEEKIKSEQKKSEIETTALINLKEQKKQIEDLYKQRELINEEEFQKKLKEIRDQYNPPIEKEENLQKSPFAQFASGIGEYLKNVLLVEDANGRLQFSFSQLFDTVANMGVQAFAQLAQGFGQMVADWVLYGNQGGSSFRKMIAQILANVAQMATTYAIMCLAAAALASTVWGAALLGGSPGQFLAAAALFGAVAVTTAVIGRAVAGNSFNNNSAAKSGFASATGSSSESSGRSSSGGGSQYSSYGDQQTIIDENRIRQERSSRHEIVLKMPRGFVVDSIEQDVLDRGKIYDLIIETAEN